MRERDDEIALVRAMERERCLRIVKRAAEALLADGEIPRGAAGAKYRALMEVVDAIRG